jgi:hypothetical protein
VQVPSVREGDVTPRVITVWVCDQCPYWRDQKTTGRHQTPNPDDPRGKMAVHELREAKFVEVIPK